MVGHNDEWSCFLHGIPQRLDGCKGQLAVTNEAHIQWLCTNFMPIKGWQQSLDTQQ